MILVRYGEIFLKGANRPFFEKQLVRNIRNNLKYNNISAKIIKKRNRIFVTNDNAINILKYVFGIVSLSKAVKVPLGIEKIQQKVYEILKDKKPKTFRITAQRLKKHFLTSQEINEKIGAFIVNKLGLKVKLKEPEINVGIEILDDAYIFTDTIRAQGGLPVGVEGLVLSLIDSPNSLKSTYLIMKRGCDVIPVSFEEFDISVLEKYRPGLKLRIIKKEEIKKLAKEYNAKAIITSETIDNLKYGFDLPILRPLIAKTQKEINDILI